MEQILALISAECRNMKTEANNCYVLGLLYALYVWWFILL